MVLDGHGHTIRQTCFEKRVLRQDGTGWLDLRRITLTRGGSDGPGAALTSRGEIMLSDCVIKQNLAEEPGGGVFSMRRVTAHRCRINGNLANDDGGAIYARRGGVQVYDSVLSTNLVDGSGGAIASTGDILVVNSYVDGNTTDGDGGALYADEDGDITVLGSLIDGSDADGPGGAIFTLDGDVAVFDSTLVGNRADDRGGAISGEADVLVVNSTVARNLAVAHAGGGIWARGNLTLVNATVTDNYAEGDGGGVLAAGRTHIVSSTVVRNIASVGGNVGSAGALTSFASVLGPPAFDGVTGDTIPTRRACRVYDGISLGHNFVTDASCDMVSSTDVLDADPRLMRLEEDPHGFVLVPMPDSLLRGRIPAAECVGKLPDPLPAGQLLEGVVDWEQVLTHDAIGTSRVDRGGCDIGAAQSTSAPVAVRATTSPPVPADPADAPPALAGADEVEPVRAIDRARRESLRATLARLDRRLDRMGRVVRRFDVLLGCVSGVGVDRAGDQRHRWGFRYDERDGTGEDMRPALVRHEPRRSTERPAWVVLRLSTRARCLSAPADPNGTGEDARQTVFPRSVRAWVNWLERRRDRVEQRTERFDAWESCLSWLPVTEAGDAAQRLGYLADVKGRRAYRPAIDIDQTEWDDPDYQLLAFRGRDHPFAEGECGTDPGESADRRGVHADESAKDLRGDIQDLREDVADLGEPVSEISAFDECLYTVGVRENPGYFYRDGRHRSQRRSALSFDMRGARLPRMSLLAFPGEEPPQIECNEDAGGVATDE
ncbi:MULTISPECIES: hypothetical protein [unclassified Nocardioides]|uniref:hypothetical protein n=1 Tax=unclassified Nocardioides TaxID=2615069 RepID=UPI00366B8CFF